MYSPQVMDIMNWQMILQGEKMPNRKHTKLLHEGKYVAEVDIEIIDNENAWSPNISLDDAMKLDTVREQLREENISDAKKYSKVYILKPVAA